MALARDVAKGSTPPPLANPEPNKAIVEAALSRVRRATETASRAAMPTIEQRRSRPAGAAANLPVDREATARALDPAPEVARAARPPLPRETTPEARGLETQWLDAAQMDDKTAAKIEDFDALSQTAATAFAPAVARPRTIRTIPLDEDEPLDYLEAEIRKVDEKMGAEFAVNDGLSVGAYLLIHGVDLITVVIASIPFIALAAITNGSFTDLRTRVASIAVVSLIAFFYLALTQSLGGRTFGMMLTNTHVEDAQTCAPAPPSRILLRTVGYFLAAVPAMLGFAWALLDQRRRGLPEIISGTLIARDF